MAFSIVNMFKKKNKQREHIAEILGGNDKENIKAPKHVPVLDDIFEEASTGVFAQIKKYTLLNSFAELLETQRTSLNKHTIFLVEILDNVVNAAIVSRKGVFLDIGFLKSYTYDELKDIYLKIVPNAKEDTQEIKTSIENIVSIVAYDVVYALPKKIVIIENTNGEFREISVRSGRFIDDSSARDLMVRELVLEAGAKESDIEYSAIKKPFKKGDKEMGFLVSFVKKDYYEAVESYVERTGFTLKKIHSIESSLYSSFAFKGRLSVMRIHIQDNTAYTLHKVKNEKFEYYQYDIKEEYEALELTVLQMQEVILSGSGGYYEMLKSSFLEIGANVRWWNYAYDLNRCIVRVEEQYELNNAYANIIATAYYELFNMRFALVRLGVGAKLSLYEFVAVNLSIIPLIMVVMVVMGMSGWYYYEQSNLRKLEIENKEYSEVFAQKKTLEESISVETGKIAALQTKVKIIEDILHRKAQIKDASMLYEITIKLPDDMILTEILKSQRVTSNGANEDVITVKGKCYLEKSLLNYIKNLKIEGKNIYLIEVKDTMQTKQEPQKEDTMRDISNLAKETNTQKNQDTPSIQSDEQNDIKMLESLMSGSENSIEYSQTLNNSFVLEIRQ